MFRRSLNYYQNKKLKIYYYLKQNDVVVVDPNYAKVQRSASNPNTGIFFSLASLLLSVIVIISR